MKNLIKKLKDFFLIFTVWGDLKVKQSSAELDVVENLQEIMERGMKL